MRSRACSPEAALRSLAIFDKPDPLDGPFFEETIYVTPPPLGEAEQQVIVATVQQAVDALGLHHGAVHAECRVNARDVVMLEIAPRPIGGLCSRVLRFARGGTSDDRISSRSSAATRAWRGSRRMGTRAGRRGGDDDPDSASRPAQGRGGRGSRSRRAGTSKTCASRPSAISCWSRCRRRAAISGSSSRGRLWHARPRRLFDRPTAACRSRSIRRSR